jgi:tetratricopeptide (TPR) repeat protein
MLGLITQGPEKTLPEIQPLLERYPASAEVNFAAGDAALQAGNPGLAAGYYQKVFEEDPQAWHPFTGINITTALGYLLYKTGYGQEAEALLKQSEQLDLQNVARDNAWWGVAYDLAAVYTITEKDSLALDWLEQAAQRGFVLRPWLEIDPLFENLRGNARFENLAGN